MKRVIGIYLAAGQSKRMGCDKLRLPIHGVALGGIGLLKAVKSQLEHIIVVARRLEMWGIDFGTEPSLFAEPHRSRWSCVQCAVAAEGQAYSLRCGLQAACRYNPDAVMILLADQPFISTSIIDELLTFHSCQSCHPTPYVAASFQGISRPPVIFGNELFSELTELEGDEGARGLLRSPKLHGTVIPYDDPWLFKDVDTIEQYKSIVGVAPIIGV